MHRPADRRAVVLFSVLAPLAALAGCQLLGGVSGPRPGEGTPGPAAGASPTPSASVTAPTPVAAGSPTTAPTTAPTASPGLTAQAMVQASCAAGKCKASKAVGYWKDEWSKYEISDYAVKRTLKFAAAGSNLASRRLLPAAGCPCFRSSAAPWRLRWLGSWVVSGPEGRARDLR